MTLAELQARIRAILAEWHRQFPEMADDPKFPVSHVSSEPLSPEEQRAAIEDELTEGGRWVRME